jgi:D-amino-acid oxidase
MKRREFAGGLMALGLSGCAAKRSVVAVPRLAPLRAELDRIFRVTVCSRPFRAAGPRLDVEKVGDKVVVHNYGHGGSGWSLSWGSGQVAVEKAMAVGEKEVAVIGCGALGLTSAILLQRAGAKVTIYAKERPPEVRSNWATGSWTPDSRVALASKAGADFPALWERMTRYSFRMYASYLGMPGNPIEWMDRYVLGPRRQGGPEGLDFARYGDRVRDLTPQLQTMAPGTHPFPEENVNKSSTLTFNVASYSRLLMQEFLVAGGRIEQAEFHTPGELQNLREKVMIHATGYGARALWKDESIVPVRGQIAWLIPQPELNYSVFYNNVVMVARRDGIVVQAVGSGEMEGYNDPNETPDRKAAEDAVNVMRDLYSRMK